MNKILQLGVNSSVDVTGTPFVMFHWGAQRKNKMCRWQVCVNQVQHEICSYTLYICTDSVLIPIKFFIL